MLQINNIYNMDCLEGMQKMKDEGIKVDCILTDPPYNINFKPSRADAGTKSSRKEILNDNMSDQEFLEFLQKVFKLCYDLLKDDSFLISFMGWSTIPIFNKAIESAGFKIKSMPIWIKESFGIGYYTRPQYEPLYLCIKGNPKPPEKPISDVIIANREREIIHSCQKPLNLIYKLLNTFIKDGLVMDPFMGSAATAIASMKLKLNFIGFELDKEFYQNAKKRIQQEKMQISLFD